MCGIIKGNKVRINMQGKKEIVKAKQKKKVCSCGQKYPKFIHPE